MKSKQECLMDLINMSLEQEALVIVHFTQYNNGQPVSHEQAKTNAERVFEVLGGEMEHREDKIANRYDIDTKKIRVSFSYIPDDEYMVEDVTFDEI